MDKFIANVERTAGFFLLAVAVLTFGSVTLRYLFAMQIPDWFDLSKLLQGIALFWGVACATFRNDHITVDIVWEHVPPPWQRRIDLFATGVLLLFLGGLAWFMAGKVWQTLGSTQRTSDLGIPVGPMHALSWAGVVVAAIIAIMRIARLVRGVPAKPEAQPATSAQGGAHG
jgi:TRAP-type C4-dicarboxylate transport system permease small subunit